MKAIVVNAGATVTLMNSINGKVRCEPLFLRDQLRMDVPEWSYQDPGPIPGTILVRKTMNGILTEICINYKDVGFAFT